MATALSNYGNLWGQPQTDAITYVRQPYTVYPGAEDLVVFPAILAPKLYGSNLDTLEIGSSGKIAVTLSDNYAFDLGFSNATGVASLATKSNFSLGLVTNQGGAKIMLDAQSNNLSIFAESNVAVSASNAISIDAFTTLTATARSNIDIRSDTGSVNVSAGSNNMFLNLDAATNQAVFYSSNGLQVLSSNSVSIDSTSNISLTSLANLTAIASSNVTVKSDTGSVNVSAGSNAMFISMDAATKQAVFYSSNTLQISSSNSVSIDSTSNLSLTSLANLTAIASSNVTVKSDTGSVNVSAGSNAMFITMDAATKQAVFYSSNTLQIASSNSVSIDSTSNLSLTSLANLTAIASSNVTVKSDTGSVNVSAGSNAMFISMDAATKQAVFYSSNTLQIASSNSVSVESTSNLSLTSLANLTAIASNNVTVKSDTGSVNVSAGSNAMFISMDAATKQAVFFSSNTLKIASSNSVSVESTSNLSLKSLANLTANASSNVTVYLGGELLESAYITLDSATSSVKAWGRGDITLQTQSNATIYAANGEFLVSNDLNLSSAAGDITMSTMDESMFLKMDSATTNATLFSYGGLQLTSSNSTSISSKSNMSLTSLASLTANASSNVSIDASTGTAKLSAGSNAAYLSLDTATRNALLFSSNSINLSASNSTTITTGNNFDVSTSSNVTMLSQKNLTLGTSNMLFTACNLTMETEQLGFSANALSFTSLSNIYFNITSGNTPVLAVNGDSVAIDGDLTITGKLNAVDTINTTVTIEDLDVANRQVTMAAGTDPRDYRDNTKAGIVVAGIPLSETPSAAASNLYEKSLTWDMGGLTSWSDYGAKDPTKYMSEPHWSLLGGAFHVVRRYTSNGIDFETRFGLRVNVEDELEFVKITSSNNTITAQRKIAVFGRAF